MTRTIEYQCEVCGELKPLPGAREKRTMRVVDVHAMSFIHCITCDPAETIAEYERAHEMTVDDGIGMPSTLVVTKRRDDD